MLNLIRDNVQSFGVKFVVGIVVVVMSFFGVSAYRSQSSNTIATVDGYEVKLMKFQRAYENAREEIRSRYGNRASDYLKMVNLESQIIQQLTSNALLLKSAMNNGLAVSDKELAREIYTNQAFMTDGRFDVRKYETSLGNLGADKTSYEKDLKENLLTQKYFRFVTHGALFSRNSLEEEYRRYESSMKIGLIEIDPSLFADQATVSEEEIKQYYELHKTDFQQKSQFSINYFIVGIEDVKDKINVREKEITRYYETNAEDEFTNKASYLSRHILISAPQGADPAATEEARLKAEALYQDLTKNPSRFAELAKTHSDDQGSARNGGELGWVEKGSFVSEFETVVERLDVNGLSKPFLTQFGYHIVEVLDKKEETQRPFEEVKAEIVESIQVNKAKRRLANLITKMLENASDKRFEELAQSVSKSVQQTGEFDDAQELPEIGYSYPFYQELNGKQKGEKGEFRLAGEDQILVYEIADIREPFIEPLNEVKEQARYYAMDAKKDDLVKQKMTEYESTVTSLSAFNALARSLGTDAKTVSFKYSDSQIGGLDVGDQFKNDVFKMEQNQIRAIRDGNQGYLVYMMEKRKGELNDESMQTLRALENMMQNQKTQVVLNALINKLQKEIDIEYNTSLLEAMNVKLEI